MSVAVAAWAPKLGTCRDSHRISSESDSSDEPRLCLRLPSSVLTNVLLARRPRVFRLQKLCGNGSDKRKTTIRGRPMRVWVCF